jgi:endonuclease/exonuclease/phosphatase family metal-dependent hydrolase
MTRIVSWNMSHWLRSEDERAAAWSYLRSLGADFVLLQEAVPPKDLDPAACVYRPGGIGGRRPWGSAILSFNGPLSEVAGVTSPHARRPARIHDTFPGSIAVAATSSGITLISVYTVIDNGYAITTFHRQLSDLTPLFDTTLGRQVVLAGDLNLSTQFEEPHRGRHRNAFERLNAFDLVDALALDRPQRGPLQGCSCGGNPCRHVRTQRHQASPIPWQNDYVFVSRSLGARVIACNAVDHGEPDPWSFSDHCPLLLELSGAEAG